MLGLVVVIGGIFGWFYLRHRRHKPAISQVALEKVDHVADKARAGFGTGIADAIYTDVNHNCAGFDHVSFYKFGDADGGDEDVGVKTV